MITQEDKNNIIILYDSGRGASEIARLYRLDHTTILYHIRHREKPVQLRRWYRRKKLEKKEKIIQQKLVEEPPQELHEMEIVSPINTEKSYREYAKSYRICLRDEIGKSVGVVGIKW